MRAILDGNDDEVVFPEKYALGALFLEMSPWPAGILRACTIRVYYQPSDSFMQKLRERAKEGGFSVHEGGRFWNAERTAFYSVVWVLNERPPA